MAQPGAVVEPAATVETKVDLFEDDDEFEEFESEGLWNGMPRKYTLLCRTGRFSSINQVVAVS